MPQPFKSRPWHKSALTRAMLLLIGLMVFSGCGPSRVDDASRSADSSIEDNPRSRPANLIAVQGAANAEYTDADARFIESGHTAILLLSARDRGGPALGIRFEFGPDFDRSTGAHPIASVDFIDSPPVAASVSVAAQNGGDFSTDVSGRLILTAIEPSFEGEFNLTAHNAAEETIQVAGHFSARALGPDNS